MDLWKQFLLAQASAGLHMVIATYGAELFTPEEQASLATAGDLLTQLPFRLQQHKNPVPMVHA